MYVIAKPHFRTSQAVYWCGKGNWLLDKTMARLFRDPREAARQLAQLGRVREARVLPL